jgi:RNA polymerase primary sigma factor
MPAPTSKYPNAESPLETYLRDINKTPLLNAQEERQLAYRIEEGDSEARDHLVRANLRLVVHVARGFTVKGMGFADLIAEGNLGLLRAAEAFDPLMGTRFATYATHWIRQAIRRAIFNTAKTVRVPVYVVELLAKWRRATAALQEELGHTPSPEEVARRLQLSKKKLAIIKKAVRVYNAAPQAEQTGDSWDLDEMLADGRSRTPDAEMEEADDLRCALGLLLHLHQREAAVLRMRFGLGGESPKTLTEIGEAIGLTRERVRQIESRALDKLRKGTGAT